MLRYLRENTGNWIIKIFLGIIVIVFVFLGVGSMNSKKNNSIAMVNDEAITIEEFRDAHKLMVDRMRERFGDNLNDDLLKALNVKQQTLNTLIEQKLVENEAKKLKVLVSDKELTDALLSIKAFQKDGVFNIEQYKKVLGVNSMNPEIFEDRQRAAMRENKIRDMVLSGVIVSDMEARNFFVFENTKVAVNYIKIDPDTFTGISPTETQIKQQYEENKALYNSAPRKKAIYLQFSPEDHTDKVVVSEEQIGNFYEQNLDRFKIPEKVQARHILIKVEETADEKTVETAREQAEKIYEKAAKGEDFAELAKEFSQGPSKDSGGYIGVFEKESMVKPFGDTAFSMKVGEISKPVRTMFGWHIIKLEARFEATVETLAQASPKIKSEIVAQELQSLAYYQAGEAFDSIVDGDDLEQVALLTKRKVMSTDIFSEDGSGLELEDNAGFAKAAFALPNDEISEVKQLGNKYYLIKVIETIEPALQPLEIVKESIVLTLGSKLRKEAAKEAAQALSKKAEAAGTIEQLASQNNLVLHATTPFTRSQPVEGIGSAPELVNAAFGLDKENPIHSEVLEAGQNFYIIGYKEKLLPEDAGIENALGETKQQILWMKQGQYFAAWVEELKSKTKIQINSELLN
ncbi:MAG: SurA N-terminal domain-containing protein [Proteobacteria bacterium]|nr:peptidyl-prolyl cis-trans isomerase [Desulfobacula sp.]MBU3953803.1 SurA N-terminal domain-containing protein [Pseudomonadota bacterium]MBU4131598.1 SurA N-terminal domain-containing protein [Pseudomonadota bacterium]